VDHTLAAGHKHKDSGVLIINFLLLNELIYLIYCYYIIISALTLSLLLLLSLLFKSFQVFISKHTNMYISLLIKNVARGRKNRPVAKKQKKCVVYIV
jgi:hypothetical protein